MWKMRYYARRYDTPATYALLALMAVIFVVDFFSQFRLALVLGWPPSVEWLKGGLYWQAFTFPFAHTSVIGLLFDGICLYWFGGSLERAWGSAKFLFFFFSSGILAGIVLIPQTLATPSVPFFTGMAGSFVGLCVAFAAMNPYAPIMFWFIPMQARVMALVIVAFDLFGNYSRYGGPIQAVMAVSVVCVYAYLFATRRVSLPSIGSGRPPGPSMKERFERWQQRRKMRQWQRRVSKIDRPEDLFKDK
ncbi:MAG TPA: rhomboid family intramembrane serine protease [Candidatus Eremiobacteraceae bacterium]|jgi:membrane associated rhomboid family serine protease